MFGASIIILAATVALALYAALRAPALRVPVQSRTLIIGGGIIFPSVTLLALLVHGLITGQSLLPLDSTGNVYRVDVTARQWSWQARYPDAGGQVSLNELHIPAGRPVDVHVRTVDVIHSFWVPRLGGKIDAIPGIVNVIRIEADHPGIYHGLCAEYCGPGHAHMPFRVIAHDDEQLAGTLAALEGGHSGRSSASTLSPEISDSAP